MKIAFFGSSLVSAYWNGAATYYRGLIKALSRRGHQVTFYEPDAFERQQNRDIPDPEWARVVVYPPEEEAAARCLEEAASADVIVKASGIGVLDHYLEHQVVKASSSSTVCVFWDVDAPATLESIEQNPRDPFRDVVGQFDVVLTYGGGLPVVEAYEKIGARECVPIYNALDPESHFPVQPDERFAANLAFLGNRLPDREARVDEFFFGAAQSWIDGKFLLAGNGWHDRAIPSNVRSIGHLFTKDHNAFNCTPRVVLNISRSSMARFGFSPATRVFEAAGAGACLITDDWEGLELFLKRGDEVLVARNGAEVADLARSTDLETAKRIGEAARQRILDQHTYEHRALEVEKVLQRVLTQRRSKELAA